MGKWVQGPATATVKVTVKVRKLREQSNKDFVIVIHHGGNLTGPGSEIAGNLGVVIILFNTATLD